MLHEGVCGGFSETMMVVWQFAEPPGPVTVRVYVVFVYRLKTVCEPESATEPMLESVAEVAFVDDHESVEEPPYCTDVGLAEMVQLGTCDCCTTTVV